MEKILYEKITQALELLGEVIGYVDSKNTVSDFRHGSLRVIGGTAAPMRAIEPNLENKILSNCDVSAPEGVDNMQKEIIFNNKTIKLRADGRYWARFRWNGKQYSVYGHTAEDCLKKLKSAMKKQQKLKTSALQEKQAETSRYTSHEWLRFWRLTYKANIDVINIETNIRLHIRPNLPNVPIKDIRPEDLQNCLTSISSTRVRKYCYNIIRDCWRRALIDRIIEWNPAEALPRVIHHRARGKALTADEEKKFFEAIKGQKGEKAFIFYVLTGVRRSELLAINANNIDRTNRLIHVNGTKTENAIRDIPLTELVEQLLDSIEPNNNGYYFREFSADFYTRKIKNYVGADHTLKDLRKTFITRASDAGIIMSATQVWAGHADIRTTGNIYNDAKQQAALKSEHANLNTYYNTYFKQLLSPECEPDTHSDTQK